MRCISRILFTVILCISNLAISQNFRPGYIITSDKNKVEGFIAYKTNYQRFESCKFRFSINQEIIDYSPADIQGYGIENEGAFISVVIDDAGVNQSKFAEILVQGRISLLLYNDSYFLHDELGIYPLRITQNIITDSEGKTKLKTTDEFKGVLNWKLRDCFEASSKIQTTKLNQESLVKLLEVYNSCNGESAVVFKEDKSWNLFYFGISGGFNHGIMQDIAKSNTFTGGVSMFFTSPRRSERLFGAVEFKYKPSNFYSSGNEILTYSQLQIPASLGFMLSRPEKLLRPTLEFGLDNLISLTEDDSPLQSGQPFNLMILGAVGLNKRFKNNTMFRARIKYSWGSYVPVAAELIYLSTIEINLQYLFLVSKNQS